jgi:DNA repair exonuclease SbcCD nuclease subunit
MNALHTADLHLTTAAADEYRWEIFPWLLRRAKNYQVDAIFIHGDLTEQKDEHPAELVNRVVAGLRDLAAVAPVHILKGNHDYWNDEDQAFFRFVAGFDGIRYYDRPVAKTIKGLACLFIPHARSWRAVYDKIDLGAYDRIFLHQAVEGAKQPNGYHLEGGVLKHRFKVCRPDALVIAGDIHLPQTVGRVTYCGSPHPVDFGDDYRPRVLLERDGALTSLERTTIRKAVLEVRHPNELLKSGLTGGDMVKLSVRLHRSEYGEWPEMKRLTAIHAEALGVTVVGPVLKAIDEERPEEVDAEAVVKAQDPRHVLKTFCKARGIAPEVRREGLKLLD